jgi:hypothetical protein
MLSKKLKKETVCVRLLPNIIKTINALSRESKLSKSDVVNQLLALAIAHGLHKEKK